MAKKSSGGKDATSTAKAGKKAGVKKTAVKKASKAKAQTASKSGTPKAAAKKSAPKAAAKTTKKKAPKKAAGPKLADHHVAFLKKIHGAGEHGYAPAKGEDRTLEALVGRKVVKKGKKHVSTGKHQHHLTKMGEKHLGSSGAATPSAGS